MDTKQILIGKPRFYPEKLLQELTIFFSRTPNVKSAYIAQIFIPDSGIPAHPVIGINMQGDLNDINNELSEVIKKNTQKNEYVDIFPVNTKWLADYFSTIDPFYKR